MSAFLLRRLPKSTLTRKYLFEHLNCIDSISLKNNALFFKTSESIIEQFNNIHIRELLDREIYYIQNYECVN